MQIQPPPVEWLPEDVPGAIVQMKRQLRERMGNVRAVFDEVSRFLEAEVAQIEAAEARGESVWPVVPYEEVASGRVTAAQREQIRRRGCVVVKGHFPRERAERWDQQMVDYVERNGFDQQYRGPGDNFFGTLSASRPEIYPIYWSPAQMEARQDERMAQVQAFLNGFWKVDSEGKRWFDPEVNCLYPDRIRRRPPGTTSNGLGPHTDSGALERWLLPAYQRVFRHLWAGRFQDYDPWDAAYRTEVNEYAGGSTMCSVFRTFQGWTALSEIQRDQGVLFTIPIPTAMAYLLLRPLLEDVPEDELCGVSPRRVLPVDERWHALLLRGKATIPSLEAGDSVWWHCDVIHGVEPVQDQTGWGNVIYIPAAPLCDKNVAYAQQCYQRFLAGESPDDFPSEHYEVGWNQRFSPEDLNVYGRQGFCVAPESSGT